MKHSVTRVSSLLALGFFLGACATKGPGDFNGAGPYTSDFKTGKKIFTPQEAVSVLQKENFRNVVLTPVGGFVTSLSVGIELMSFDLEGFRFQIKNQDNQLLTQDEKVGELKRRVGASSTGRTCFTLLSVSSDYGYQGKVKDYKWAGYVQEKGGEKFPLHFDEALACTEKELSLSKAFAVVLSTKHLDETLKGQAGWYIDQKDRVERLEDLPVATTPIGIFGRDEKKEKTISAAISTNNMLWFKKEIPPNAAYNPQDRIYLAFLANGMANSNGSQCQTELIKYLYTGLAHQDPEIYEGLAEKNTDYQYRCIPYARQAYLWTPKLRNKIFHVVFEVVAEGVRELSVHDSPQEIQRQTDALETFKFIHRNLSAECVAGETDKCVLLDASAELLPIVQRKVSVLQRAQRMRDVLQQIMKNEATRKKGKSNFI